MAACVQGNSTGVIFKISSKIFIPKAGLGGHLGGWFRSVRKQLRESELEGMASVESTC